MTGATLGDIGWEVEWCYELSYEEDGSVIPDSGKYRCAVFKTKKAAEQFARKKLPHDKWGSVRLTKVEFSDPYSERLRSTFRWEPIADPEYID